MTTPDLAKHSDVQLTTLATWLADSWERNHLTGTASTWRERLAAMPDELAAEYIAANSDGYDSGCVDGYSRAVGDTWPVAYELGRRAGYRQATARWDAEHSAFLDAANRQLATDLAGTPSYVELCERRGEHERAQRARRLLRERGIA